MDVQETRRAVCAIGIVGQIDGKDVIYRDSAIEIVQRRERELQAWRSMQQEPAQDEPVAKIETVLMTHGLVEWLVHGGEPIKTGDLLYARPQASKPNTEVDRASGSGRTQS